MKNLFLTAILLIVAITTANAQALNVGNVTISYNGSRLCDGGEIEAEMFNLLLMFNKGTNVCFSTKTPLLQNRC
jgi:uncharacterized protein HemY